MGRTGSGALPPPTARPLSRLPGPTTHWPWGRRDAGVGARHQPHSARPCELALRAVGAARGRQGGLPPAWVWGVRGRALSQPRLPALWTGCRGPLPTGCGCRGLRAWGPVTNPTARSLACCGGGMRVPGGGASCLCVGRPGSGALPPPTARPLGGLPRPTTHWLWVRGGAGAGTRHQPHSARSCELSLRAVEAARVCPGGAPPAWLWGVRGRALSHPPLPALWAGCRGPLPTGCGCGGVRAWGPVTNPTARALACCGGGMRVPGLGWVGSRPHPDLRDHGHRPSLRVTTGPAGSRLSGLKAYRTDDRPRTPRWHTREGDAAVPVCLGKCVAWCSRPRWGGWGSLTLSPPGELSAWTRHLQVYRHAAGRPLLPMAGGGQAPHTTWGGPHSLIALARVVLL